MGRWNTSDLPDMSGRTVVVTGAARGLGLITARELGRVGARVVLAVRDTAKGAIAVAGIPGRADVRELDVSDLDSIRRFARDWSGDLDVLINNAGIMNVPLRRTTDGFESQMATNYFGPFALTNLLLPHVTDRVVFVSSQLHRQGKVHLGDLAVPQQPYKALDAYNDSKLAVVLLSTELQRRLAQEGSPVRSVVAHPGIASTDLAMHSRSGQVTNALRFLFNDPERGALSLLYAATQDVPGNAYVGPSGLGGMRGFPATGKAAPAGVDPDMARRLWMKTAELTGTGSGRPATA